LLPRSKGAFQKVLTRVHENLFVGSDEACFTREKAGWAVVHACKDPCHRQAVGYEGSLPEEHPNYLTYREDSHLYLNLIDPPFRPLFKVPFFIEALDFIEEEIVDKDVLVHCNEGLSRSPSVALLFLAARAGEVDDSSFPAAREEFERDYYSGYSPSGGIRKFLNRKWEELVNS
jgi:hypothetical protein